jgi:hypothetical protein
LGITRSVAVNGARFLTRVPVLTPKVKDGCKLFVQAWQEYKLAAVASGLRSGANPSGMIANEAGWAALSTKCDALSAQIAIWFPELLQRIDVSIDGLYDAAKAMRTRVAANGNLFSSVVPLTPKTAAAIAYGFAYCLKVGKDATKRSLAGLLQHIRSARGQINGLEAVPDELVDEVGRLQSAEFEGLVALADEARLTSVEDAVAGFNIAGNSMERAGRLATLLGEQYAVVIAKCRQLNMTAQEMKALLADFSKNTELIAALRSDVNLLENWCFLSRLGFAKNRSIVDILRALKDVVSKQHLTETDIAAILRANNSLAASAKPMESLLAALGNLDRYKNCTGYALLINDLKTAQFGKNIGAQYVCEVMKTYPSEFPAGNVIFESVEVVPGGVRRIDVKLNTIPPIYYEFKSVSTIPPTDFVMQFTKDLSNAEVTTFSQLKWYFDRSKLTSLNKQAFMEALNNATIPESVVVKWSSANPTKSGFLQVISQNFDIIFKLK